MQKLTLASILCLGSLINAVEINTQEKFLGLPLKVVPPLDTVNPTDEDLYSQKTYPCTFKVGNGIYDFTPFKLAYSSQPISAFWNYWDVNMTDPQNPTLDIQVYTWNFTWCEFMSAANTSGVTNCTGDYFAAGSSYYSDPLDCTPFSGSTYKNIVPSLIGPTNVTYDVISGDQTETYNGVLSGVQIQYTGGAACPSTGAATTFTIKVYCNTSLDINMTSYQPNVTALGQGTLCDPVVQIVSQIGGCDLLTNSIIWEYISLMKPYIGVVAIVGGFMLCFYGLKLVKPSVCFVTFLSCIIVSLFIFYAIFLDAIELTPVFWYFLGGGIAGGLVVGLLMAKYVKFGAAMLGGWGGFAAGLILNEAILFRFELSWLFWVANGVCIVAAAIITYKIFEPAIIAATAVVGAYFIARGVSVYLGHYYNEFTIINQLKAGAYTEIDPLYWGYVGGFVLFTIVGICYQRSTMPKKVSAHPYHR